MTGKDAKRCGDECARLIESVNSLVFRDEDIHFDFISEDEKYKLVFADYLLVPSILTKTAEGWKPDKTLTLEKADEMGISWKCTQDFIDLCEDTIMEVKDHISAHQSDIALFARVIDKMSGEPILGCYEH